MGGYWKLGVLAPDPSFMMQDSGAPATPLYEQITPRRMSSVLVDISNLTALGSPSGEYMQKRDWCAAGEAGLARREVQSVSDRATRLRFAFGWADRYACQAERRFQSEHSSSAESLGWRLQLDPY